MPKFNQQKNALIAGELSPKLDGRVDLPQYINGCRLLQNMIPLKQGGAVKRPGTIAKDSTGSAFANITTKMRLIPFVISNLESYIIGIGGPGFFQMFGERVQNGVTHTITQISGSTNYADTDLDGIQFVQSADTLFLVHPNYKPQRIIKVSATAFQVQAFDANLTTKFLILNHPYLDQNVDAAKTIAPSATTGTGITLTANFPLFDSNHVGAMFKLTDFSSATGGAARITAVTSSTVARATVFLNFANTTATNVWEESAWSDYRGWPGSVCFSEGRLVYGGSKFQPDTFWGSRPGKYDNLMARKFAQDMGLINNTTGSGLNYYGPLADEDAYAFTLNSQRLNRIQWISDIKTLSIGTTGSEHVDPKDAAPISAKKSPTLKNDTAHGSAPAMPVKAGRTLVFVQRSGAKLMEIDYDFYSESYAAEDLIFIADHLVDGSQITQIAYQEDRQLIWCITAAGKLFCCLRDKTMQITAWASQVIGGVDAKVLSVCVKPSPTNKVDDVWLYVSRTVGGTTKYFIEFMHGINDSAAFTVPSIIYDTWDDAPAFFADYSRTLALPGDPVGPTVTLANFANETLSFAANGFAIGNITGNGSGVFSLGSTLINVTVGFPYTSIVQPMRPEAGAVTGSAQGQIKRIDKVIPRFYRTNYAKIGPSLGNLETINFRDDSIPLGTPTPYYTGDKAIFYRGDYDMDGYVYIVSDLPLPFGVTSIATRGVTLE